MRTHALEAIVTDQVKRAKGHFIRDASRFVASVTALTILYDNKPSGANDEIEMILALEKPLAIVREKGHHGSSRMLDGIDKKHTFVRFFELDDNAEHLVGQILAWSDALLAQWQVSQDDN